MASRDGRRLKKLNSSLISAQLAALFSLIDPALEELYEDAESAFDLSDPAYLSVIDRLLVQHATVLKEYKKHKSSGDIQAVKGWMDFLLVIKFALLANVEAWAEPET